MDTKNVVFCLMVECTSFSNMVILDIHVSVHYDIYFMV